jgi:hypothetical protein
MTTATHEPMEIRDVRENSTNVYYTLNTRTSGTLEATVTVLHTRHNTFACLTCLSVTCKHSAFVEQQVRDISRADA